MADLFAEDAEKARDILDELKLDAKDALDLALSEAPGGSTRTRYRYVKEQIFPLLLRIEDAGERRAALGDVAKSVKLTKGDLNKALTTLETKSEMEAERQEKDEVRAPEPGTERYEKAMGLLKCPDILQKAAQDMERFGHVGETNAKKLGFTCGVSARANRPIQPSTHAQSSSGKNFLWDTVLSLMPPEKMIKRSGFSAKSLFRTEADLKGAVLYIQEVAGSEDADFSIRVLQSDGRLEYESTEKMLDGSLGTVVYVKEGPCVVVQTTTKDHLYHENETRVFPIYIDESPEQTHRIVDNALKAAEGRGISPEEKRAIQEVWHDAIRLLEPAEVVIPYAGRIQMPTSQVRIRRDVTRLLDVIRVRAWLHQHQRDRDEAGRIIATEEDFDEAKELVEESLLRAWKTLTPAEEKVLSAIEFLPLGKRTEGFKKRDLQVPDISERRLNEVLKSLVDTGHLDSDGKRGPQGYTYTLPTGVQKLEVGIHLRPSLDSLENTA